MAGQRPGGDAAKAAVERIAGLVDDFCRSRLNDEYAALCGELVGKLARKRPTPLTSGRPEVWACGIVRTIGWVNYLDDPTRVPHLKLTAIDAAFGVAESTGQGKSLLIRRLLKIRSMDPQWTLPSRIDQNPRAWTISVNGLLLDARFLRREIQEEAFFRGLIPYLPETEPPGDGGQVDGGEVP